MDGGAGDLIEVEPAAVVAAGQSTAGTGAEWESWAGRCAHALAEAGQAAHSPRIEQAGSAYAQGVVRAAREVGRRVGALGDAAVSAGALVDQTDAAAASVLRRPVDGGRVAG